MILRELRFTKRTAFKPVLTLTTALTALATTNPALAQGSPVPGAGSYGSAGGGYSSPAYATTSASAPVPGSGHIQATAAGATSGQPGGKTKYHDLPITADSAKYRLEELRALLAVSRPQEMQDSVQELCEWLNDASDAHYRMYLSFAKSDLTKAQANSEKQLNQHFSQLKREAQLLRADLLIKQLRAPEALAPLVDIVVADPRSNTGKEAYKRLVDLGFSQAVPQAAPAAAVPAQAALDTRVTVPVVPPREVKAQASSQPLKPLH